MNTWIDVHHHFVTPRYVEELARIGVTQVGGRPLPNWTFEDSIDAMDRCGIAAAVVSLIPPGLAFFDAGTASEVARAVNDEAAAAAARHPDRLGFLAALPLPDVDAALEEAARALDTLGADGVGLLSNHRGVYLGDARFEPLFAELDRRGAVVAEHPTMTGSEVPTAPDAGTPLPALPPAMIEFPFDTTRAIANLLSSGTLSRHPHVRFISAHAGGTVPLLANRLIAHAGGIEDLIRRSLAATSPEELEQLSNDVREETFAALRGLYYDTSGSANPTVLGPLRELAPTTHILAGTDLPFVPESSVRLYLRDLERYSGLMSAELAANARRLFPRFASSC